MTTTNRATPEPVSPGFVLGPHEFELELTYNSDFDMCGKMCTWLGPLSGALMEVCKLLKSSHIFDCKTRWCSISNNTVESHKKLIYNPYGIYL